MAKPLSTKELRRVLDELYDIDASLREHEDELTKVIRTLAEARPVSTVDERFVEELKQTLTQRINERSMKKKPEKGGRMTRWFSLKPIALASGGVAVGLIAAFVIFKTPVEDVMHVTSDAPGSSYLGLQIDHVAANAFGIIDAREDRNPAIAPEVTGMGGGGNPAMLDESMQSKVSSVIGTEIARPYYGRNFEYVYVGDDFSVDQEQMDVLKQISGSFPAGSLDSVVRSLNLGAVDLSTFRNMEVQNITLVEQEDLGYIINVDATRGSISISQNWERWNVVQPDCRDEVCWNAYRLKPEDVPADERIIDIANRFMEDRGINLSSYGDPVVDRTWEVMPSAGMAMQVPDVLQVVYPLEVEGKRTYDPSGNPVGLWVGVNIRANRVSYVGELRALRFEASSYETERDTQAILDYAKRGGLYGAQVSGAEETVQVEIGTPTLALTQVYSYENGQSQELQVPALVFPVIGGVDAEKGVWRKNIVVPVVKGAIQEDHGQPVPLPLLEEDVQVLSR